MTLPDDGSAPDWAGFIAAYLDELRDVRRASPNTLDATTRDLQRLQAVLVAAGHCRSGDIRRWIAGLHQDGHQTASLQRYLSSARGFFRFAVGRGWLTSNPTTGVRAPRHRRKLPMGVAADALGQALDQRAGSIVERRDRALLEALYSSGMRLAEAHGLNVPQVAHGQTELRIIGKGEKERIVWLGSKARSAIDDWLSVRPQWLRREDEPALWLNPRGGRLSRSGIGLAVKAFAQRTGLEGRVHPHRLRHAFATHMLEESGDLRAVQELLGHAQLATTQIYTHVDFKRLASVYDGAHPRARKRPGTDDVG
ncbi:tyrosine-type recombinase/integrase [Polycyclovorans algicola]|uniref:tyrosine-type recombinase/integrase n=1 Tax=Polycyclovorans algicola TaxID=616992 RepID=UPI0004A7273A|nr:tyrosine-type recombinase/integrase [Polycyclovorans algicola]